MTNQGTEPQQRPQTAPGIRDANSCGFTAIEMLAVLLVLSLLVTMIVSVIHLVQRTAEKRQAEAGANALVQAVSHYRQVYGAWPGGRAEADVLIAGHDGLALNLGYLTNTDLAAVMAALAPDSPGNPRQILFLTVATNALVNGCLTDPWRQPYLLFMGVPPLTTIPLGGLVASNLPAFALSAGPPVVNPSWSNWVFSAGVKP